MTESKVMITKALIVECLKVIIKSLKHKKTNKIYIQMLNLDELFTNIKFDFFDLIKVKLK